MIIKLFETIAGNKDQFQLLKLNYYYCNDTFVELVYS